MQKAGLIEIYPLEDKISVDKNGEIPQFHILHDHFIYKTYTSEEYVRETLSGRINGFLDSDIKTKILNSQVYKSHKKCQSDFSELQQYINNYSRKGDNSLIINNIDKLIKHNGILLSGGQVLFHGGEWFGGYDNIHAGQTFVTTMPLSTTFSPSVAYAHANYHPLECIHQSAIHRFDVPCEICGNMPVGSKGSVWHITVGEKCSTPAIITNMSSGKLSHEMEVIFASGAIVHCDAVYKEPNWRYPLVFVTLTVLS